MLIVRGIGPSVGTYYLDGRDAGRWTPGAGRLLGLTGTVRLDQLGSVLRGCDPGTGDFLPRYRTRRRRSGWDLIFSAPKSVSLLGRCGSDPAGSVAAAHEAAVSRMIDHLEDRLTVRAGQAGSAPAAGLIGARFEHRSSAAGEPHVHTHVLVANLTSTPGGWTAVRDEWFVDRRGLDALYQLSMRWELAARGWQIEWRLHPDGRGEVAAVPTAAARAASTQSRLVGALGRFRAREQAVAQPWRERVTGAGWDPTGDPSLRPRSGSGDLSGGGAGPEGRAQATDLLVGGPERAGSAAGPSVGEAELTTRVTNLLAARRSDFRTADVLVALAACHPGGATPVGARAWAERFCSASRPVRSPTAQPRWTTGLARAADDRLAGLLEELRQRPGHPGPAAAWNGGVAVLASPPGATALLAQAEILHRLRREWALSGVRAAVVAPTDLASARWRVLTGLPRVRPGSALDVVVVDQADRLSTAELLHLAGAARRMSADLVLVEGGTMPRLTNPASHGMAEFAASAGRVACPEPGLWEPARGPVVAVQRVGDLRGRAGDLRGRAGPEAREEPAGRDAAASLLSGWAAAGKRDLLVGLGLEEVCALNAAARSMASRPAAGSDGTAPALPGGHGRQFRAGDRVVVLRAGEGRPPCGTFGEIVEVAPSGRRVAVSWDGSDRPHGHDRHVLSGLGHGWAVTPRLAERVGRPVMLLGASDDAGRLRPLIRASLEPAGPDRPRQLELRR
ncbi:MAG TPA: MobF family relaxase [Acidimicrobiales bacterium]|nr:MobF family relaxase [Acidimicrobiales bacterium]